MPSDITLTASMRSNLASLKETARLTGRTQERLSTGKKVNSALDDPMKYFAAQGHISRATDLEHLKTGMGEAIQTIKAADTGITGVLALLEQARAIADNARSAEDKASLAAQFEELIAQARDLANAANYKGVNLLAGNDLQVDFEGGSLSVAAIDAEGDNDYLGTLLAGGAYNDFATEADITSAIDDVKESIAHFRTASSTLAGNLFVINTRSNFTQSMVDVLGTGADELTAADMNEESANMLMLQTRQQLGVSSLQLASEAAQSILKLF